MATWGRIFPRAAALALGLNASTKNATIIKITASQETATRCKYIPRRARGIVLVVLICSICASVKAIGGTALGSRKGGPPPTRYLSSAAARADLRSRNVLTARGISTGALPTGLHQNREQAAIPIKLV